MRQHTTHASRGKLAAWTLAAALGALCSPAQADILGPESFGYRADTAAFAAYEDISATGTQVLSNSDDASLQIPIGFSFSFYGAAYTNLFVSTNGLVTFGIGNNAFTNQNLTTSSSPAQAAIAPLWDDWRTDGMADAIYYSVLGTPGVDRRLVIQWHVVTHFGASGVVDFELALFEDGTMEFRYLDVDGLSSAAFNNGGSATIGIRNVQPPAVVNGEVLQMAFNAANSVINGQTIRITNNQAPDCSLAAPSLATVAANNHLLVPITAEGVSDPDGDVVGITVTGVFQDEGVLARGSGNTCPDGGGLGTSTALIRAERVGNPKTPGDGRVYTISFTGADPQGASCSGAVKVCVPHDSGNHSECVETDAVFDSLVCPQ